MLNDEAAMISRLLLIMLCGKQGCQAGCRCCSDHLNNMVQKHLNEIAGLVESFKERIEEINIIALPHSELLSDLGSLIQSLDAGGDRPITVTLSPFSASDPDQLRKLKSMGVMRVCFSLIGMTKNIEMAMQPGRFYDWSWWDTCWSMAEAAVRIFGGSNAALHLGLGLGETEQQALATVQKAGDLGIMTYISPVLARNNPHILKVSKGKFYRVMVARYLLAQGIITLDKMKFNDFGQVIHFGIAPDKLVEILSKAEVPAVQDLWYDCSNLTFFHEINAWFSGSADFPKFLQQLCSIDWVEAWTNQRRVFGLEGVELDDEEIEAENGSIYKMIAESGANDQEDED
jgi:biotin synthase-related radical SAM superfamily protein